MGDFSLCTTKTKELQVVGRSYANLFLLHPNYLQPTANDHSGKIHFHFLSFDFLEGWEGVLFGVLLLLLFYCQSKERLNSFKQKLAFHHRNFRYQKQKL